jgi:pimeloyl-ACP methyl ester carboxylesterase
MAGCATPAERGHAAATARNLHASEIVGGGFTMRVFANGAAETGRLRIYFDGDGTPWLRGRQIATDPTPRRPLVLDLLRADPAAALLVARPCYYGGGPIAACSSELWTAARYGETVVDAMTQAVAALLPDPATRVTLIGYSGGGVIALLVAERIAQVDRVITVAANLDHGAWTRWHGYAPLTSSLNPTDIAVHRDFDQVHLMGGADRNVPPQLLARFRAGFPQARFVQFDEFDHVCCWTDVWPDLLATYDPEPVVEQ